MKSVAKWFAFTIGVVAVSALSACSPAQQADTATETPKTEAKALTAEERSGIADAIVQRNKDLLAAWAKPDAFDSWMALCVDENHPSWAKGQTHLVVNHQSWGSRAEMDALLRPMLKDRITNVTMKDESVAVLSPETAVHFGNFTFSDTRDGVTSKEFLGAATTVWTLDSGEWKILHYHQSWPTQTPVAVAASS